MCSSHHIKSETKTKNKQDQLIQLKEEKNKKK